MSAATALVAPSLVGASGELSACEYRDVWRYVYDEVGALLALAPMRVAD